MIQASRPPRKKKAARIFPRAIHMLRSEIRDVTIRRSHSDRWPDFLFDDIRHHKLLYSCWDHRVCTQ